MSDPIDTILIVDDDPAVRTLLREQVFTASTFRVYEAKDGPDALQLLQQHTPDLVVLDLVMPGLSGHDMLVAMQSQGFRGPLLVMDEKDSTRSVVEAFRLGATDYVTKPVRETEMVAAVERGLADVRLRRERNALVERLKTTNTALESRVNELTTLYITGKSVASMSGLENLFQRILEGALNVTNADQALLLLRDDKTQQLILRAGRNLQLALLDRLGEPVSDGLADLVMSSGEALNVAGDGLKRFPSAKDQYAVVYVPLMVQTMAIGVLGVGNHEKQVAFDDNHTRLLKSLADYAAIAIVNVRLYSMLDQRSKAVEESSRAITERETQRARQFQVLLAQLNRPLASIDAELVKIARADAGRVSPNASQRLVSLSQKVKRLAARVNEISQRERS